MYAAAVKGDAQVTLVETWPLFANEQGDAKEADMPDLLHPNKTGYAKWGAALRPLGEGATQETVSLDGLAARLATEALPPDLRVPSK